MMIQFSGDVSEFEQVSYTVRDDRDIYEITQAFKQFLLAIGYHPGNVSLITVGEESNG